MNGFCFLEALIRLTCLESMTSLSLLQYLLQGAVDAHNWTHPCREQGGNLAIAKEVFPCLHLN